jgi:hypothetical protein
MSRHGTLISSRKKAKLVPAQEVGLSDDLPRLRFGIIVRIRSFSSIREKICEAIRVLLFCGSGSNVAEA